MGGFVVATPDGTACGHTSLRGSALRGARRPGAGPVGRPPVPPLLTALVELAVVLHPRFHVGGDFPHFEIVKGAPLVNSRSFIMSLNASPPDFVLMQKKKKKKGIIQIVIHS